MNRRGVLVGTSGFVGGMMGLPTASGYTEGGRPRPGSRFGTEIDTQMKSGIVFPIDREQIVPGDRPVRHRYGWSTIDRGPGWIRDIRSATTLEAAVDGVPVDGPTQYWDEVRTNGERTETWWTYESARKPGTHEFEVTVEFDQPVTSAREERTFAGEYTLSGQYTVVPSNSNTR